MSLLWDIRWVNNLKTTWHGTRGALVVTSGCLRSWSATWNMLKMFFLTFLMLEVFAGGFLTSVLLEAFSSLLCKYKFCKKCYFFWQSIGVVDEHFSNKLFLLIRFSTNSSVLSLTKQIMYFKYLLFWYFGPLRLLVYLWPNTSSRAEIVQCFPALKGENEH